MIAEFRRQQMLKDKKLSRRTYYVVARKAEQFWMDLPPERQFKLYERKPTSGEFIKVRASRRSEARLILDQNWNRKAA
jgi:hypothetical protein